MASHNSGFDTANSVLHRSIDRWIQRLQWPVAITVVALSPCVLWAALQLASRVLLAPLSTLAFSGGVVLFMIAWRSILKFRMIGPWLMRAEHEATHLLFAILTLHPIVGLSREEKSGSYVRFLGRGNWLIQIAPYFFPTAAIPFWLLAYLASWIPVVGYLPWPGVALGVATGFHVVSTIREIRRDHEELKALSWKFCWMFLPASNLFMLGCLIAFAKDKFSGLYQWMADLLHPLSRLIHLFQ